MNWRKPLIFAGLYLTGSKIPRYLKEIKRIEKLSQEEIKINRGNFEANVFFIKKTGLLTKDKKILEIGSGNGTMVNYLSKQSYNIIGTEINEEYVSFAKNNFGIKLKKISGENIKFKDNSFDSVLSFDVFEHIPNSDKHLQEVKRVLKPKGHYLLQTPNKWTIVNDFFKEKIKKQFGVLGLTALKFFNPDIFPYFLKTNFYLVSKKGYFYFKKNDLFNIPKQSKKI